MREQINIAQASINCFYPDWWSIFIFWFLVLSEAGTALEEVEGEDEEVEEEEVY